MKRGESLNRTAEVIGIIGAMSVLSGFLTVATGFKPVGKMFGLSIIAIGTILEGITIKPCLSSFINDSARERVMTICDSITLIVGVIIAIAIAMI